jgi:hypothetical protein
METSTETAEPPDLRTLFGALDMCDCEQCKSVYSPAAYLVDVLKFLEDRPQKLPLQVLLGRRPDLAEIALTCENTQTPLPYVDLVNEVLEEAVALRVFEITLPSNSNIVAQLNSKIVTPGLTAEFKNQGLPISDAAIVRIEKASERWSVFDPGWKFSLSFQSGKITVRPWPQTSWQPAELKANPEHLSDKAYDKLQASVYPWQLPFNLWIEEARIYLNHLGLERADLMETLFKGSLDDARKNRAIAGEFLQITPAEADLIDGTTSGDPNVSSG